jgi:hypothetical protein
MTSESMAELTHTLKNIEEKTNKQRQEQMQHEQQMQQAQLEQQAKEKQLELDHESMEKEKDRRVRLLEAEIKAAGYGSMQDINQNLQSDYADQMDVIRKSDEFQQVMGLKQQVQSNKEMNAREKLAIERERIQAQRDMKNTELQIAKENKNKYDVGKSKENKQKKK